MAPPPQASADLYSLVQRYQLLLLFGARRLWRGMTPDFDSSWSRIAPSLVALTSGAQLAAARAGTDYVPAALEQTGQPDEPLAAVRPQAFAGVASDGRSLAGLLEGSVVAAKRAVAQGAPPPDALLSGQKWLEQALQTAVTDAARDATAAQIAVRPGMGWVRMVNPPCCSRCAVLAGRWYRWSAGFDRHPRCDCLHIPAQENRAGDYVTDPNELVRRGLITDLTHAQRERIDGGADLSRVLNESRDRWRQSLAADRRAARTRRESWGRGGDVPPTGTIHDLMDRLTSQVEVARAMRRGGLADKTAPAPSVPLGRLGELYGDRIHVAASPSSHTHVEDFSKAPEAFHRALKENGTEVWIGPGSVVDLDGLGYLADVQPRGWRQGATFREVAGVYSPRDNVIAIGDLAHGSHSIALHEGGHGFDAAIGMALRRKAYRDRGIPTPEQIPPISASQLPEWRKAYEAAITDENRRFVKEYFKQGDGDQPYSAAGLNEAWAETFAAWVDNRSLPPDEQALAIASALTGREARSGMALRMGTSLWNYFEALLRDLEAL